jgi:hypothetical protein
MDSLNDWRQKHLFKGFNISLILELLECLDAWRLAIFVSLHETAWTNIKFDMMLGSWIDSTMTDNATLEWSWQ